MGFMGDRGSASARHGVVRTVPARPERRLGLGMILSPPRRPPIGRRLPPEAEPAYQIGMTHVRATLVPEQLFGRSNDSHPDSFILASACSGQNRISMSRYIVIAVVRCPAACSRSPVRR